MFDSTTILVGIVCVIVMLLFFAWKRVKNGNNIKGTGMSQEGKGKGNQSNFSMTVQDVFSIKGRGTVVTGTIAFGTVQVHDNVEIVGKNKNIKSVITGVEKLRKTEATGITGDDVGILMKGIERDDVERGNELRGF